MPSFIVIHTKKGSQFYEEAKVILEGRKFTEINPGTFMGNSGAQNAVKELKNLDSYKNNKSKAEIKIYSGTLS